MSRTTRSPRSSRRLTTTTSRGRFNITPRAFADLVAIGSYTRKTWGEAQRDKYLADLDRRFQWLADHPKAGRLRDELGDGYRSFVQGSHVIFYISRGDAIDIIGAPHQAMDMDAYFGRA